MTPQASDPSMNFNISQLVQRYWHSIDIVYYFCPCLHYFPSVIDP